MMRFVTIAATSFQHPSTGRIEALLFGLSQDGRVYTWSERRGVWLPLPMDVATESDDT